MIPYIYAQARPDYKRPCVDIEYGAFKSTFETPEFIAEATLAVSKSESLYDIWQNRKYHGTKETPFEQLTWYDIDHIIKSDTYMDNQGHDLHVYVNDAWICWMPQLQDIWKLYESQASHPGSDSE